MQGRSCFNFASVDEPLFAELARITEAGFDRYLALAAGVAHLEGARPPGLRISP
jgi:hypothetical protein